MDARPDPGPLYFDATLSPHRSLPRRGFFALLGVAAAVNAVMAAAFWMQGAWLIAPFLGLDVAILGAAFWWSYRSGRTREHVRLTREALTVAHVTPSGRERVWRFEPTWARVALEGRDERSRLLILSHGKGVQLGEFLTHEERADFADALSAALRLRRGNLAA